MSISGVSSASSTTSSTQSSEITALQQQKVLLQNQITQLETADAEANADAIEKLQKQLDDLEEQIAEAKRSSSTTSSEKQSSKSDDVSSLNEKFGAAYSVELTGQKKISDEDTSTDNGNDAYSVELGSKKNDVVETLKDEQKAKDEKETKKNDALSA